MATTSGVRIRGAGGRPLLREHFHPDILFLARREDARPAWLPGRTDEDLSVPRGRGRGAVFFIPLVDLSR